jgi:GNAT superfamily N-acetyltransferase
MSAIPLTFEPIVETDIPELTRVMTRAFNDDARRHLGIDKAGPPGYDDGGFFRQWLFGYQQSVGIKALIDGRIVAAGIVWLTDTGQNYVGTIFVDPPYQDRGIGQRSWQHIEHAYPDAKSWQLETPASATRNHYFYVKCGFTRIEVKPATNEQEFEGWVYKKQMVPGEV